MRRWSIPYTLASKAALIVTNHDDEDDDDDDEDDGGIGAPSVVLLPIAIWNESHFEESTVAVAVTAICLAKPCWRTENPVVRVMLHN